jgi:hypothetical protein
METARISHAALYAVKETGRLAKSLAFWFLELLALAMSYGLLLTSYMVWEMRSDLAHAGLWKDLTTLSICFAAVVLMAFMNFIWTGYIATSLIARILCMSKLPRLYPLILPCLVVIHITIILLEDHGDWGLSISFPLFVGWGAATAFATAWYSVKIQKPQRGELAK